MMNVINLTHMRSDMKKLVFDYLSMTRLEAHTLTEEQCELLEIGLRLATVVLSGVPRRAWIALPQPASKTQFEGRLVRTSRELSSRSARVPPGTIATIRWQAPSGSTLVTEPCPCCGLSAMIEDVPSDALDFIAPADASRPPVPPI